MIPFYYIFFGILGATLVPVYVALYLVSSLRAVGVRYLAAAGVGLAFWFFYDTMGDAASLLENNSVYPAYLFGGLDHLAVIGAFLAGVAVLAVFDRYAVPGPRGGGGGAPRKEALFLIPAAIALVMGIHSLGEGWDAASAVAGATVSNVTFLGSMVQAFGDVPAVISYPIHKFLEGSIVAIAYAAYVSMADGGARKEWWHIPVLGLLFGGPSVIGAAVGYYVGFDTTFFFAFGVTSALYAVLRLAEPMGRGFGVEGGGASHFGGRVFVALTLGFFLLYFAALLH